MKKLNSWIAIILVLVILAGTSVIFVDHKLMASDVDGGTTAQELQEIVEGNNQTIVIELPAITESEPEVNEDEQEVTEEESFKDEIDAAETAVDKAAEDKTDTQDADLEDAAKEEEAVEVVEETSEEEAIENEQAEVEIAPELISVSKINYKVSSRVYAAGENAAIELGIQLKNTEGAILKNFILEVVKVNSVESTERKSMSGFNVMDGKLAKGEKEFEYKLGFVPFDGENTSAFVKVIIRNTDKEETELASCVITFERALDEPAEDEPTEEEPAVEEPAAEEPAEEEPAEEEPAVEEPAEEEPAEEEPAEEEPAAEEPAEEEPAVEEPTEEELTEEEQDISESVISIECEETHDRLSLKVNFDANVNADIIPAYQWEYAPIGSEEWQTIEGAETSTLSFENSIDALKMQYRCAIVVEEERLESPNAVFLNEQEHKWVSEGQVTTLRELASARYWNSVDILVMEMGRVRHLESDTIVAYVDEAGYVIDAASGDIIGRFDADSGRICPIEP